MPLRKKYGKRKFTRKSGFKRRGGKKKMFRRKFRSNMSIVKSPYVSDRCFVKFKYTNALKLTSPIGQSSFVIDYRGNGAIDPDCQSAYSQYPLGWETYVDQYKLYRCFGSKVKIRFSNEGTHSSVIGCVPVVDLQTFVANATTRGLLAQRYARYKLTSAKAGVDEAVVKNYMKTKKMFSNMEVKADMDFAGNMINATFQGVGPLPKNQWYWAIFGFSPDTTSALAVNAIIDITYYCRLEIPRQPVWTDSGVSGVDDYAAAKVATNDSQSIVLV